MSCRYRSFIFFFETLSFIIVISLISSSFLFSIVRDDFLDFIARKMGYSSSNRRDALCIVN